MKEMSENARLLVGAVVGRYLTKEEGSTVKEIAALLEWSESKVRRTLNEGHGLLDGITLRSEGRTSYSKSYRMMESGNHLVNVYYPTLAKLRAMLVSGDMTMGELSKVIQGFNVTSLSSAFILAQVGATNSDLAQAYGAVFEALKPHVLREIDRLKASVAASGVQA